MAYFACFVPSMVFTFAVCAFTMAELTNIQKAPVRATLARLGCSSLYGGLGLLHLFVEQGIAQIQLLLRHRRAQTPQGSLMLIGLSWWHLVAGFSSSLWENTQANIPYVDHTWYTSLKENAAFLHWHPR
jgi:hypothetical protein